MGTRHSLATISLEMERQKRDAQSRQEQDRVGRTGQVGLRLSRGMQPFWKSPMSEGEAWLCPGEASRLRGELQPSPGSPHLRDVAQLCPGESPSLEERPALWTAFTRHQGITKCRAGQSKGPCLELKVNSSAGPVGSSEGSSGGGDDNGGTAPSEEPICPRAL